MTALAEVGIWRPNKAGTYVANRSEVEAAGGWRRANLPNSTLRIGDLNWNVIRDVEGRIFAWRRTVEGKQLVIVNNSPEEEEMSKKSKRDHGTAADPKPVTYTLPEPEAEAPKAEVKTAKTPKPVEFPAEKEARSVGQETKLGALLASLAQGATMEQLIEVLSKSGSVVDQGGVRSWLGYDVKRVGYGIRQDGNLFYLVFPDGMTEVAYKQPKETTPALKVERGSRSERKAAMRPPKKSAKAAR